MNKRNILGLVLAIGISEMAGVIGSIFTVQAIPTWYAEIVKPSLNPPSWVFGPVWTTLYLLMGIAAWLVWIKYSTGDTNAQQKIRMALTIFGVQLFLNAIWSILFFGLHSPLLGLIDIILLWISICWTIFVFSKISRAAAYLLVPYILWVSFALYLNYSIWVLN